MKRIHWNWLMVNITKARATTLFPFVFFRDKKDMKDAVLLIHERTHIEQQKELFLFFFLLIYFGQYLVNLMKYDSPYEAYRNIVFEREAFANEKQLSYLCVRKRYAWVKYFKREYRYERDSVNR